MFDKIKQKRCNFLASSCLFISDSCIKQWMVLLVDSCGEESVKIYLSHDFCYYLDLMFTDRLGDWLEYNNIDTITYFFNTSQVIFISLVQSISYLKHIHYQSCHTHIYCVSDKQFLFKLSTDLNYFICHHKYTYSLQQASQGG